MIKLLFIPAIMLLVLTSCTTVVHEPAPTATTTTVRETATTARPTTTTQTTTTRSGGY